MLKDTRSLSRQEFVPLMALMTSLIALSIDAMLPAFPAIESAFAVSSKENLQMIIAILFLGFGFGQLVFGPLSDVFGRKPPIYWGIAIFIFGSALSGFANSFELFILGRFLQGFGGASPRIISLALIRDEYSGDSMAQITSLVMSIFIFVPAVAPTLGQGVLYFYTWREIFIVLAVTASLVWLWFGMRQPETLLPVKRKRLSRSDLLFGMRETFRQKTTRTCMLVSGLVFGIFVGYLGAVQSLFEELFDVRETFPLYFGMLALCIGSATFFNSRLVMALGMRKLILIAFTFMTVIGNLFAGYLVFFAQNAPPLWMFMAYMMMTFFSVGFLFGNLNALAMTPLGHVAGMASALLGFVQSTFSSIIGIFLGRFFQESITPLVLSFALISLVSLFLMLEERHFFNRQLEST